MSDSPGGMETDKIPTIRLGISNQSWDLLEKEPRVKIVTAFDKPPVEGHIILVDDERGQTKPVKVAQVLYDPRNKSGGYSGSSGLRN